jgi:hypothetical protein
MRVLLAIFGLVAAFASAGLLFIVLLYVQLGGGSPGKALEVMAADRGV